MAITSAMIKDLRERTGAGLVDCKKALSENDGDMDKSIEWLRKNGLAKAEKKAGRIAAEGTVAVCLSDDKKSASIVEVNSETDFVSKNEKFKTFAAEVAKQALDTSAADIDAFLAEKWSAGDDGTVEEKLKNMIATIGENMNIRRFAKLDQADGTIVSYIHAGGKIGVIVSAKTANVNDEVNECLMNVAMQIAAMNPLYVSSDDVSEDYKKKELEILVDQAKNDPKNAGKPDNILEKMVTGRLNKQLKEICLLDQIYVKAENKETVSQYVANVSKSAGDITLTGFVRYETGEGLEKKEEDFAAEVAAQAGM